MAEKQIMVKIDHVSKEYRLGAIGGTTLREDLERFHAKIRKKEDAYYLTDMNSRNGTAVNGRLLLPDEEYQLEPEDEVDFAQARYIFLP